MNLEKSVYLSLSFSAFIYRRYRLYIRPRFPGEFSCFVLVQDSECIPLLRSSSGQVKALPY